MKIAMDDFCDLCKDDKEESEYMLSGKTSKEAYAHPQTFVLCKDCMKKAIKKIEDKEEKR
jgi:hypothetical protein